MEMFHHYSQKTSRRAVPLWAVALVLVGVPLSAQQFVAPGTVRVEDVTTVQAIHGEWFLYPGEMVGGEPEPGDAVVVDVPANWALFGQTSRGFGTYRISVHVPPGTSEELAVRVGFVPTAYRLWVNGRAIGGVGVASADPEQHRPQWYPAIHRFPAPADGRIDLRLEVSNWEHGSGGLRSSVHFGSAASVERLQETWAFRDWIFIGAALLIAFYHLALYIMRPSDRVLLWFAMLAFSFAIRSGYNNAVYWNAILTAVPWSVMIRIEYLSLYGIAIFLVLYAAEGFNVRVRPFFARLYLGVMGGAVLLAVAAPVPIMTVSVRVVQALLAIALVVVGVPIVRMARNGDRRARSFVIAGALALGSAVFDSLYFAGLIGFLPVGNVAGVFLLLSQSFSLAHRFSTALVEEQRLSLALAEVNQRLEVMVREDNVTGLPNRVALYSVLEDEIARTDRTGHIFAVLFIDLDNFKHVNDTLGHNLGDELLRGAAMRMRRVVRQTDRLFRLGGDEFVVVCVDLRSTADIDRIARALTESLGHTFGIGGREVLIGASMGISHYPAHGRDPYTLMQNADAAMYAAKRAGRGRYLLFSEAMALEANEHLSVGGRLPRALQTNLLSLVFQPQVLPDTRRIVAAEALLRWNDPELGTVPPSRFIPVAEDSGLIVKVGEWVMRASAGFYAQLNTDGAAPPLDLSINLSAAQLTSDTLLTEIGILLNRGGLPPERLILEVTEHAVMRHRARSLEILGALREQGIRIALDDFGTGYSSLANIRALPVDEIKIDRSFVSGIDTNPKDRQIVRWIVHLARELRLAVTAEGVETEEQRDMLGEIGVDKLQGYLTGRPMPFEDLRSAAGNHTADAATRQA